jgi:error-prone DNA polymerase
MATFKFTGGVSRFEEKLLSGMIANGYHPDFAARTFRQLEGFGSYGFPMSHAMSFAMLAYVSSWVKHHHPDVFLAALLNAQPMGFYAPAQLVRDAEQHGVEVRPVDVNRSHWDAVLEASEASRTGFAVRLGMRQVRGLANKDAAQIVLARGEEPYASVEDLWRRAQVPGAALQRLAKADAFGSLDLRRRPAAWAVGGLSDAPLPLFAAADERDERLRPEVDEPAVELNAMPQGREVVEDYRTIGLTLRRHPVSFVRGDLDRQGVARCADLRSLRNGQRVTVAGLVLVRQRPGSAKGVMFITLEDESADVANLVVWPSLFEKQRRVILSAGMVACHGKVQREGEVIHVVADHLTDLSDLLRSVGDRGAFPLPNGRGDEARHGGGADQRHIKGLGKRPRDIYIPDLHIDTIKVKTRDFR